jgi:hypothetical protein
MMRKTGFYWCRKDDDWRIAMWSESAAQWSAIGWYAREEYWDEVDERRIVRDE